LEEEKMQSLGLNQSPKDYTVDEVYGITRDVPLNYVTRTAVDNKFVENLTRQRHIAVYGSSKQGKTCLRKHCLKESDYIVVQCSDKWALEDIHSNILKRAGFKVTQSERKAVSGKNKILASVGGAVFGIGAKLAGEKEDSRVEERTVQELELDPTDVNDVIAALKSIQFSQFIVLEDFHYLPVETQKEFAVALKAFHEASNYTFIIIGVWLDENRIIVYNGDLTGRVVAVSADVWSRDELAEVVMSGARLLNVKFTEQFVNGLIPASFNNVYIVQEACRQALISKGITHTQSTLTEVGEGEDVNEIVKEVVSQQTGRYLSFITQFSEGFQTTRLEMYKWLLFPILTASAEKLEKGFKYNEIRQSLQSEHPSGESLNPGNLTQALQSVASLQVQKNIKPIILDYDETNRRLNVVDRGFIIWMQHQDREELLRSAELRAQE
jgi:hypothetical protein